jgi:hypothetical protein
VFFPERSNQVPDRPVLTLVVLGPERTLEDELSTRAFINGLVREVGNTGRTFKSGLLFAAAQSTSQLNDDAKRLLAWEEINEELPTINIDETQRTQLGDNIRKAQRDLRESVWRAYKNVLFLGKDNGLRLLDMGLVHSSAADTLVQFLLNHLKQADEIQSGISPNFLVRSWSPAFKEWSTRAIRDAFYASPVFPRLLNPEALKETIARGVQGGVIAYVGKGPEGKYQPFHFEKTIAAEDIEISDETFLITQDTARGYRDALSKGITEPTPPVPPPVGPTPPPPPPQPDGKVPPPPPEPPVPPKPQVAPGFNWAGDVPPQKWMNFYTKVLAKYATSGGLSLRLEVKVAPTSGVTPQQLEEVKAALRELGLNDRLE